MTQFCTTKLVSSNRQLFFLVNCSFLLEGKKMTESKQPQLKDLKGKYCSHGVRHGAEPYGGCVPCQDEAKRRKAEPQPETETHGPERTG